MRNTSSRSRSALLKLCLIVSIFVTLLSAQTDTAGLFGLVKDPSGATVANSKIRLQNRATGAVREQVADAKGFYQFEVLPPGEYALTVEAAGFKQFRDSNVRVQVAQVSRLNVQLEIGATTESIEVQATVSPLNTETVAQGTIVGEPKIAQLPLNGRQFIQLALLVPGANAGGRAVQQNAVRQGGERGPRLQLDELLSADRRHCGVPGADGIGERRVRPRRHQRDDEGRHE
jgi:hypothetical protein